MRQLYRKLYRGDVPGCSLLAFEDATGLSLTDDNGLKDDLPPITTFLNRLLALTIAMQGILFTAFEELLAQRIEGAIGQSMSRSDEQLAYYVAQAREVIDLSLA